MANFSLKKIPDHAEKVFSGVLHDVYQWEQELFDGSTTVFEAIRRRDGVAVVAVVGDKIIVNHEEQPYLLPFTALPGGICEEGSSPLENIQRELREETGCESDDWELWFSSDVLHSDKIDWNVHFFIARDCRKTHEQHLDPGEKIENTLVTFEEFLDLRHNPAFRNKDLSPILAEAAKDEQKKAELKKLLFGAEK